MPDAPNELRKQAFSSTAEQTFALWSGFIESKAHLAGRLFDRKLAVNLCINFLVKTCEKNLGPQGQIDIVLGGDVSGFAPKDWVGKPASWLWRDGPEQAKLMIDVEHLQALPAGAERQRVIHALILHELGHAFLHWKALCAAADSPAGKAPAKEASYDHEEEAWWFYKFVEALSLAGSARKDREGPPKGNDRAYLICSH